MPDKFVDTHSYLGPDRRRRSGQKRWKDRRQFDDTTQPPPLGQLLRRLRVQMTGLSSGDDRVRALQILRAAIAEAERQHFFQCADALKRADRILRLGAPADAPQADAFISEAADHAGEGR